MKGVKNDRSFSEDGRAAEGRNNGMFGFSVLLILNKGIVKSFMKNRSGIYGKSRVTLPLEGGGKRVGVKGLTGIARRLRKHSTDTERHLWRHLRDRQIDGSSFVVNNELAAMLWIL